MRVNERQVCQEHRSIALRTGRPETVEPPVARRLNYLVDPVNSVVKARAKRAVGIRSAR